MLNTSYESLLSSKGVMDLVRDDEIIQLIKSFSYQNIIDVTIDLKNRLDLISHQEYGVTYLWWYIAVYNSIIDPLNFKNDYLYIPEIKALEGILVDALIKRNMK